jgi:hypothetical protein
LAIFLPFLKCTCSSTLWLLMPLLHSGPIHNLSPSFRRFGVPHFAWFPVQSFLTTFSLCTCHCCMAGCLPAGDSQFLPRSTIYLGLNIPEDDPFSLCHFCTAGQLPAGGGRHPPGSTISPCPFLWLSASPCRWLLVPMPPLHCFR